LKRPGCITCRWFAAVNLPVSCCVSGAVRDAAVILSQGGFHSVPVVDGTRLAGIVTSSDLIHYLVEQYGHLSADTEGAATRVTWYCES
jgi:CBS domain-containing protein